MSVHVWWDPVAGQVLVNCYLIWVELKVTVAYSSTNELVTPGRDGANRVPRYCPSEGVVELQPVMHHPPSLESIIPLFLRIDSSYDTFLILQGYVIMHDGDARWQTVGCAGNREGEVVDSRRTLTSTLGTPCYNAENTERRGSKHARKGKHVMFDS